MEQGGRQGRTGRAGWAGRSGPSTLGRLLPHGRLLWAGLTAVLAAAGTAASIYSGVFKHDPPVVSEYSLPVDAYARNLLIGDSVVLALEVYNTATRQQLPMSAYDCDLTGVPPGIAVTPSNGTRCSFSLTNLPLAGPAGNWPVQSHLRITGTNHGVPFTSPPATLYFHDVARPALGLSSFAWVGDALRVTANIRLNREKATIERCEWRPAVLFAAPDGQKADCSATFTREALAALAGAPPKISVVVRFSSGGTTFAARSDDVTAVVPGRLIPFYAFPDDVRQILYTTNSIAIEAQTPDDAASGKDDGAGRRQGGLPRSD